MIDPLIHERTHEFVGSKGLVFIEDSIVVFRRDTKTKDFPLFVDLPGGGREENETPFETFKREVCEEFGLHITESDIVYARRYPGVVDPTTLAFFLITKSLAYTTDDIVFGDEGLEYFLITPEAYVELSDAVPKQQERVRDYLNYKTSHV